MAEGPREQNRGPEARTGQKMPFVQGAMGQLTFDSYLVSLFFSPQINIFIHSCLWHACISIQCFVIRRKGEVLPGLEDSAVWLMSQIDNEHGQMETPENNLKAEREREKIQSQGLVPGPLWGLRGCCGVPGEKDKGLGWESPASERTGHGRRCVARLASHLQLLALRNSPGLSFVHKAGPNRTGNCPKHH